MLLCRESLYEDEEFDLHQRQLAALLVSKVKINCSAFLIICFKLVCDRQDWLLLSEFTCELHPKDSTWLKINTWKLRTISKREILNNYMWIWSVGVQICVSLHPLVREDCIFHWMCKFYYLIFSLLDLCFFSPRFSTIWVNLMTHFPMPLELVPCLMCRTILIMFILFLVRMFLCFFYLYERENMKLRGVKTYNFTSHLYTEIWEGIIWLHLHELCRGLLLSSAKAIDEYASLKSKAAESNAESVNVDSRLEAIVERMLNKYAAL